MLLLENTTEAKVYLPKRAFFIAFFTLAVLFVFQPFGTFESEHSFKYLKLSGYGLVTFFAVFVTGLIEIQLSKFRAQIPIYPYLILSLYILIGAVFNHSYFVVAILEQWHWMNQLMFIVYVAAIAALPIAIIYFKESAGTNHFEPANEAYDQAKTATEKNTSIESIESESIRVSLIGENKSDHLAFDLNALLFIKSADNYCEIVTADGNASKTNLIRISLTKALEQLPENSNVVRCHRSFAVNIVQVAETQGNANGMQLRLKSDAHTVPVSRSFVGSVKEALSVATEA